MNLRGGMNAPSALVERHNKLNKGDIMSVVTILAFIVTVLDFIFGALAIKDGEEEFGIIVMVSGVITLGIGIISMLA